MQQFIKENLIYWMVLSHWRKFVSNKKKVGGDWFNLLFPWVYTQSNWEFVIWFCFDISYPINGIPYRITFVILYLGAPCTALREVSLLKGLKHNNIVSLHDIIFNQTTLTLVFEYVEKDLKQYMDDCGNILHIKNVRLFLFQLLRGLDYCHSRKILHRDLK